MKTTSLFLISVLIASTLFTAMPVSAETVSISFSDMDLMTNQEFWLYSWNGTSMYLVQQVNLSSTITLDTNTSTAYVMVLRPTELSWFENPIDSLKMMLQTIPRMLLLVFFAFCLLGSVAVIVFVWRRR
ncbi:MAG: hypothetical protein WC683_15685 [bacterium]